MAKPPADTRRNPLVEGRVRQSRDDNRPTEDDLAKKNLGQQGVPGKPDKGQVLDQDKLQNPKPIDPGHTA